MSYVIFTVADNACYGKPLDILCTFFSVAINNVVDCTLVVLLENVGIENILAYELLVGYGSNQIPSVPEEDDDIIKT